MLVFKEGVAGSSAQLNVSATSTENIQVPITSDQGTGGIIGFPTSVEIAGDNISGVCVFVCL